jgi:hypothetical protein
MGEDGDFKNRGKKPDHSTGNDGIASDNSHPFRDQFPPKTTGNSTSRLLIYEGNPAAGASEESKWFRSNNSVKQPLRPGFQFQDVYPDQNGRRIEGVIWVVDQNADPKLAQQLQQVEQKIGKLQDPKSAQEITGKCEALARYIDGLFGGPDHRPPPSEAAIAMNKLDVQHGGESAKKVLLSQTLVEGKAVCLQKALLYKVLADHLGLPVTLERGTYGVRGESHAYNVARLPDGSETIFDVEKRAFEGLSKAQASEYGRPARPRQEEPRFAPDPKTEAARRSLENLFRPAEASAQEAAQSLSQQVQDLQRAGASTRLPRPEGRTGSTKAGTDPGSDSRNETAQCASLPAEQSRNLKPSDGILQKNTASDTKRPWWEKLPPEERTEKPGHELQHKAVQALRAFVKKNPPTTGQWNIHESEQHSAIDQVGHDVLIEVGNGKSLVVDLTGNKESDRKAGRMMVVEIKDWMLKPVTDANGKTTYEFKDSNIGFNVLLQILTQSKQLTNAIDTPANLSDMLKANPDLDATKDLSHQYIRQLEKRMNWKEEAEKLREKVDRFFSRIARLPDQTEHRKRHVHTAEELETNTEEHQAKQFDPNRESLDRPLSYEEIDRFLDQYIKDQKEKGNLEDSQKFEEARNMLRSQPELRERMMAGLIERLGRTGRAALEGVGAAASLTVVLDFILELTGL